MKKIVASIFVIGMYCGARRQLLAMVEDAGARLKMMGYSTGSQFLMVGFSASGTLANRFTLIHPDRVKAVVLFYG